MKWIWTPALEKESFLGWGKQGPKCKPYREIFLSLYTVGEGTNIPHSSGNVTLHPFWLSSGSISPSDQYSLIMTNYDKFFREIVIKNWFLKDSSTFTLKILYSTSYLKIKATDVQEKLWISVFTFSFEILLLNLPHLTSKLLFLSSSVATRLLSIWKLF